MTDTTEQWGDLFGQCLVLRHVARHAVSFTDRARAGEKLAIAEADMAKLAKRKDFDLERAARYAEAARAAFAPVLAFRAWPAPTDHGPNAAGLPAYNRPVARPCSEYRPTWPTMRTRGGLAQGLIG